MQSKIHLSSTDRLNRLKVDKPKALGRFSRHLTAFCIIILFSLAFWGIMPIISFAQISCSQNPFLDNDLIGINAAYTNEQLVLEVYVSNAFGEIPMPGTTARQFDFFIDKDQDPNTGDSRPGAIRGVDYRVSCIVLLNEFPDCYLFALPLDIWGVEQNLGQVQSTIIYPNKMRVFVPLESNASDIIAFARGGISGFYGSSTGNGDRCPESGIFDTTTGTMVLRAPVIPVDNAIEDPTGSDLLGWRFQTFGNQFRISMNYKYPVDPLSTSFSGRIELDTDRDLNTGLVQTPFLIPSPFNEIASWGWDAAIDFKGGDGIGSDPTPFILDFGTQSIFILPPEQTYAWPFYFPFGEGYNDGRWYISENQVVLEGSLSILDARQWRIVEGTGLTVDRRQTDGKVIGRMFTRTGSAVSDMIPKNDKAFDFGSGTELPAINWTNSMVSGSSPQDHLPQWDITKVDAQIDGDNLVIACTLTRLESTWSLTSVLFYLETDPGSTSGIPINNEVYNTETIIADYYLSVEPIDLYVNIGYTANLRKVGEYWEGKDSGLSIQFSNPEEVSSPAKFIVTIPLAALGHPTEPIRLYAATYDNMANVIVDVAPLEPLSLPLFLPDTGSLQVTIEPSGARDAGARWRVTSGPDTGWKTSGTNLNLPVGNYTVAFNTVSGWSAPSNADVTVSKNTTTTITRHYIQSTTSPTGISELMLLLLDDE